MIVADLRTSSDPVKDEDVVVALIENILDMDATTPDEDAISKKASGVTSPSPNLPDETVENLAKGVEAVFLTTKSLSKSQPPETVSSWDKDAGPPAPQSSLTYPLEALLEKVKWEESNCNEAMAK